MSGCVQVPIQPFRCIETVANIKRAHAECDDSNCMTNKTLIHTSRTCRAQNPESMDSSNPSYDSNARSCSEDDEVMAWTSTSEASQVKAEILQVSNNVHHLLFLRSLQLQ